MGGSAISGHLPVVRCLPTVASSVRAGVTVYTRGRFCNDADVKPFLTLFSLVGHCEEVPEKLQDSFAAFSGSGVAFVSYMNKINDLVQRLYRTKSSYYNIFNL